METYELKLSDVIPRMRREIMEWQEKGYKKPDLIILGPDEWLSFECECQNKLHFLRPFKHVYFEGCQVICSDRPGVSVGWTDGSRVAGRLAYQRANKA